MNLKDIFVKYNYLKNEGGLNEMLEELKELEEKKYSIKTCDFSERVQTSMKSSNHIENIDIQIEKFKFKIIKNKNLIDGIDRIFRNVLNKEFKFLFDYYIKFDEDKKKLGAFYGLGARERNKAILRNEELISSQINFILRIEKIKFDYL